jgi:hypothetical protein
MTYNLRRAIVVGIWDCRVNQLRASIKSIHQRSKGNKWIYIPLIRRLHPLTPHEVFLQFLCWSPGSTIFSGNFMATMICVFFCVCVCRYVCVRKFVYNNRCMKSLKIGSGPILCCHLDAEQELGGGPSTFSNNIVHLRVFFLFSSSNIWIQFY